MAYAPPKVTRAVAEKNSPWVVKVLPVPVNRATRARGTAQASSPSPRMRTVRARLGRSACRASSGINGGGPPGSWPAFALLVRVWGRGGRAASRPRRQRPPPPGTALRTGPGQRKRPRRPRPGLGAEGAAADPQHGLGDDRDHGWGQAGEDGGDRSRVPPGDVD